MEWHAPSEINTLGYWLYRTDGGDYRPVHEHLLVAPIDARRGSEYQFVDRTARPDAHHTYWLLEVSLDGGERWHGPYERRAEKAAERPVLDYQAKSREGSALERDRRQRLEDSRTFARSTAVASARASGPANRVRIATSQTGIYRVAASELATLFGQTTGNIEYRISNATLALEHRGQPVAWWPSSGGDALHFFAEDQNDPFSARDAYFVSLGPGAHAAVLGAGTPVPAPSTGDSTMVYQQDSFAATAASNDPEADFWFWAAMTPGNPTYEIFEADFELPDVQSSSGATITLRLFGATESGHSLDHQVAIEVNGSVQGTVTWDSRGEHLVVLTLPGGLLSDTNTLRLTASLPEEVLESVVYVNSFEVDYERAHRVEDGELMIELSGQATLSVDGLASTSFELLDVTSARTPVRLVGALVDQPSSHRASFDAPAGATRSSSPSCRPFTPCTDTFLQRRCRNGGLPGDHSPGSCSRRATPCRLPRIARAFHPGDRPRERVRRLRQRHRQCRSDPPLPDRLLRTQQSDAAIRRAHGQGHDRLPRHPRARNQSRAALTRGNTTRPLSSDSALGDVVGNDGVPEIAIGRIPVLTEEELSNYIDKVESYESGSLSGHDRVVIAADDPDTAGDFTATSNTVANLLSPTTRSIRSTWKRPQRVRHARL